MLEDRYDAFISYRRSDGSTVARWLRRELVRFRAPRSMRAQFGRKLKVYLDTAYERGTSDFYEQNVRPALLSSSYLLVVATPAAIRRSDEVASWIAREISDFTAGPNGQNVIAVRGAGEFNDPLPGDLATRFPNIEIVDLRGASRFWYLYPARIARLTSEKLKLVAPLLDVPFDEMPKLRQEEERRQQSLMGSITGAVLAVLVAVSGLSIFALQSRNQAIRSLQDSMFATGSMVILSTGLTSSGGSANERIRRILVNQGCDLIDNLSSGSGVEPAIDELVTCRLERALGRDQLGEQAEARALYDDAIAKASARYARVPRSDAAERLLQARQAYAEYFVRQKDNDAAEAQYKKLHDEAQAFAAANQTRSEYARAEGEALGSLGDLYVARGDRIYAGTSYDQAAVAVHRKIGLAGTDATLDDIEWMARLYRLAGEQHRLSGDPDGALVRYNQALEARSLVAADHSAPAVDQEAAITNALIFSVEQTRNDPAAAQKAIAAALAAIGRVLGDQTAVASLKQKAMALQNWIEMQQKDH
jgi:tetratricopeptide (TPR) repeat protein